MDCIAWIVGSVTAQLYAESQLQLEGEPDVREHDGDQIHFVFGTIGHYHVTLAYSERDRTYKTASFMHKHFGYDTFQMFVLGGVDITSNFPHRNLPLGDCIIDVPAINEDRFFMAESNVTPTACVNANRLLHAVDRYVRENQNQREIHMENGGTTYVVNAHPMYKDWDPEEWENLLCCGMEIGFRVPCIVIRGLSGDFLGDGHNLVPWFEVACQAAAVTTRGIIELLEPM
jgi:hypothetical protein